MLLALMIILPWQIGDIARSESSAIPFIVFREVLLEEGYLIAFCATITNIIYLLWIFYIPGHLVSRSKYKETGVKITYPYIINILIGLLLVTPSNPVYKFMLLFV
ncbi:MAG: hypothetical protein ACOCV8_03860 [Spirochaetota bacterium]